MITGTVTARMSAHASSLTPQDLALHAALGIDVDLLERAQVRRVDDRGARDLLCLNGTAGDFSGIEYPYYDPLTARRQTSRLRLDHPSRKSDGTPEKKYRAPYGDRRHLYFPPGAAALLPDVAAPVAIVEAEKSALALTAAARRAGRPLLAIALGGCWNWRGRIGKESDATGNPVDVTGPLPDFDRVAWLGRDVIVAFDARPNPSVTAARRKLARVLRAWGAVVRHAHLPDDDPRVNGPDDLIGARGDDALWRLLDGATSGDFLRDKGGAILTTALDNVRLGLSKLGVRLAFDAFAREVHIDGRALDDVDLDRLWVRFDDQFSWRPSRDTLRTVIVADAHEAPVHPVRRYLDGLTWDGMKRLDSWLIAYGGATDSPYVRAVGALPLIAAVRRVRQPGAKFDELLILESPQGTFKSSALRALCPDEGWFSDDLPLGVDSKLVIERTAGRWIIEAAELHGNSGREVEALKAFLSRQCDGPVRLAYGRLPVTVPRQFVQIGTTNASASYLKDGTGARRFWPVAIAGFDVESLRRDRDQLWAEAAARERAGASTRLDPALWAAAGVQQEQRRAADPWESVLEPLLAGGGSVAVDAIWAVLKLEANQLDNRHAERVAGILQRHGLTRKKKRRIGGGPPRWFWTRGEGA
jgi:hypothetical protein